VGNNNLATILIVDDNGTMRTLLRGILRSDESADYVVAGEANDCETALEQALKIRPDVVCLDIMMPKGSGLDVLKKIKAELPHTVVLMVTSSHDAPTVKAALDGGAGGYIVKPFNSSTILNVVRQAVDKARALKAAAAKAAGPTPP